MPEPSESELLIKVAATAVNRSDINKREGNYPSPLEIDPILGIEIAGEVVKVGTHCSKWKVGDRVFGLLSGGGYAEYAVIPEDMVMRTPANKAFHEAVALPEVFLTAYQTLFWQGELKTNQKVLIHAGASGVGTAAIQLAKQAGATVFVTAGSEEKLAVCKSLGADVAIHYKTEAFDDKVAEVTAGQGVDLVLDFIGAPYWQQNIRSLGVDGKLILIGALGGMELSAMNLAPIFAKRLQIIGTLLSPRSHAYKAQLTNEFAEKILPLFNQGKLLPVLDKVFPFKQLREAHTRMEQNKNIGKIVLALTSEF